MARCVAQAGGAKLGLGHALIPLGAPTFGIGAPIECGHASSAPPTLETADVIDVVGAVIAATVGLGGTLLAAGVALVGLLWVFRHERNERADERFDAAVADLMRAIGAHATEREAWLRDQTARPVARPARRSPRRDEVWGGPMDASVNIAADIALMHARTPDRQTAMKFVGNVLYMMGFARSVWAIAKSGEIVADLRRWRIGDLSQDEFIERMKLLYSQAVTSGEKSPLPVTGEPAP